MEPNAKLLTRNGELVHEFLMMPFQLMPEVCTWGSRTFVLRNPFDQKFGAPAEPIYYEALNWPVQVSDHFLAQSRAHRGEQVNFIVNGKAMQGPEGPISYADLVLLAVMKGEPTITWRNRRSNLDGILSPGERHNLNDGDIFSVAHTGNA